MLAEPPAGAHPQTLRPAVVNPEPVRCRIPERGEKFVRCTVVGRAGSSGIIVDCDADGYSHEYVIGMMDIHEEDRARVHALFTPDPQQDSRFSDLRDGRPVDLDTYRSACQMCMRQPCHCPGGDDGPPLPKPQD